MDRARLRQIVIKMHRCRYTNSMRYKYIFLVIVIIIYTGRAVADETEWVDPQNNTLRLAESFTREGYLIEATDFYDDGTLSNCNPCAFISVYDGSHNLITQNITRINDWIVVDGRLNLTIVDLQAVAGNISSNHGLNITVDEWVKIETRVAGRPAPRVVIFPYEKQVWEENENRNVINRVFIAGDEIPMNFSIINEGKAVLENVTLKINSSLPLFPGEKLNFEPPDINNGTEYKTITVRFIAPSVEQSTFFTISAEVDGNDVFGRAYTASDSTDIEVVPAVDNSIELKKYVSEKVYMGDAATVTLSIKNNGSQTIDNVSLTDALPEGLEPLNTNLSWNFTLGPYEQKSISYQVKPQEPGTYIFPAASSLVEYPGGYAYNVKPASLIVNGPYVVLIKSADPDTPIKGEKLNITVTAINTGDYTAIVKLRDSSQAAYSMASEIPDDSALRTMVLHPGDSASVSYELNVTSSGSFVIPPARATVFDQFQYEDERYTQKVTSNSLEINVSEPYEPVNPPVNAITPVETAMTPIETATPEDTETPAATATPVPAKESPGFEGYAFILFMVLWVIRKSHRG